MSRKIRKFRTDKFDTWNKRKFWLMQLMQTAGSQPFAWVAWVKISVCFTYRIYPFETFEFFCSCRYTGSLPGVSPRALSTEIVQSAPDWSLVQLRTRRRGPDAVCRTTAGQITLNHPLPWGDVTGGDERGPAGDPGAEGGVREPAPLPSASRRPQCKTHRSRIH